MTELNSTTTGKNKQTGFIDSAGFIKELVVLLFLE
jgi:hypothetical protein